MVSRFNRRVTRFSRETEIVQATGEPLTRDEDLISEIDLEAYRHWLGLWRGGQMPGRPDFDPAAVTHLLPYLYLVDVLDGDFRYRLVGSDIASHTIADNTRRLLSEIRTQGSQETLIRLYEQVLATGKPHFQRIRYRTRFGVANWYETVVLPLAGSDGSVKMLLGAAEHFDQTVDL